LIAGFLLGKTGPPARFRWLGPAVVLALAVGLDAFIVLSRVGDPVYRRFPYFIDYLPGWTDLDSRIAGTRARIAYAGNNLPYYLLGRDLENDVRYVNLDGHRDWLLHDYHRAAAGMGLPTTWPTTRPGWDRVRPKYDEWLANLDAERIQFLVVTRADPGEGRHNPFDSEGFPVERAFADAHPQRFRRLYADKNFRLYSLKPPAKNRETATDPPASSH
jgi:hypothetical protein